MASYHLVSHITQSVVVVEVVRSSQKEDFKGERRKSGSMQGVFIPPRTRSQSSRKGKGRVDSNCQPTFYRLLNVLLACCLGLPLFFLSLSGRLSFFLRRKGGRSLLQSRWLAWQLASQYMSACSSVRRSRTAGSSPSFFFSSSSSSCTYTVFSPTFFSDNLHLLHLRTTSTIDLLSSLISHQMKAKKRTHIQVVKFKKRKEARERGRKK